jgi:hypothetical protein
MAVTTRNSAVAVQSLDGSPISQSRKIMISFGARSVPRAENSLPYYSEPVEGRILVRAPPGLNLRASDGRSGKLRRVASSYRDGRYLLPLDRSLRSSWLLLDGDQQARGQIKHNTEHH